MLFSRFTLLLAPSPDVHSDSPLQKTIISLSYHVPTGSISFAEGIRRWELPLRLPYHACLRKRPWRTARLSFFRKDGEKRIFVSAFKRSYDTSGKSLVWLSVWDMPFFPPCALLPSQPPAVPPLPNRRLPLRRLPLLTWTRNAVCAWKLWKAGQ